MPLTLRRAGWRDLWRLYRWRNDPSARAMMCSPAPLSPLRHVWWFWRLAPDARPFVAETEAGVPIGSGRLDIAGGCAEFDVLVAPGHRGHGYGAALIGALVDEARVAGCATCRAWVRRENAASLRAFARQRFALHPAPADGSPFLMMERRC